MRSWSAGVALCLLLPLTAVDRHNFRTCGKTAFCKRLRDDLTGARKDRIDYNVDPGTVSVSSKRGLQAILVPNVVGRLPSQKLALSVTIVQNNIVRVSIKEQQPIRERYEVPDVLVPGGRVPTMFSAADTQGPDSYYFEFGGRHALHAQLHPLKITVLTDGNPTVVANGDNLFAFEAYRNKRDKYKVPDPNAKKPDEWNEESDGPWSPPEIEKDDEPADAWSERFKSHTYDNKRGPAAVGMDFTFVGAKHVYGIPEHASSFALKNTRGSNGYSEPYRLYNLDVFEYELDEPMALYGSIPFAVAHRKGSTSGVFWLNSSETFVDVAPGTEVVGRSVHWMSETGVIEAFILPGPAARDVMGQYAKLTGPPALPPLFAAAYHQCRWNYNDQKDVAKVNAGFETHQIPYDVLWLDIEHTNGKRYFTWDKHVFPDPVKMQNDLAALGRKMVTIIDPHIKKDSNYHVYKEAHDKQLFVKNKHGDEFKGWCWPGDSAYLDFTNQSVRDYWSSQFALDKYTGSTHNLFTWNDMNEPSVFNGPEITMDKANIHHGDWEHRDVHNLYGYYVQMATYEGIKQREQGSRKRPFVLSRAFFAGSQRYGAVWTGDNTANWEHFRATVAMLLSHSIAGLPFIGADVGGFFGNPDPELLWRWYQLSAYTPFFRGHAHKETSRREPWLFGDKWTARNRAAIRSRYRVLPYVYTLFHEAHTTGVPVMRPLWFEFEDDEPSYAVEDAFMLGDALLVHPVVQPSARYASVYLPGDNDTKWYLLSAQGSAKSYPRGSHTIYDIEAAPLFLRSGHILVQKQRPRRSSYSMRGDPYSLAVAVDNTKQATGALYIDDEETFDYQHGAFQLWRLDYDDGILDSSLEAGDRHLQIESCKGGVEAVDIRGEMRVVTSASILEGGKPRKLTYTTEGTGLDRIIRIRKPVASICKPFRITLSFAGHPEHELR